MRQPGPFSSGELLLTETEATWLPPEGITVAGQRRNRTGLRSASVPGSGPGRTAILSDRSVGSPVGDLRLDPRRYLLAMKKFALLVLAVALVALLASLKFKKRPTAPEAPEGTWELAEDASAS